VQATKMRDIVGLRLCELLEYFEQFTGFDPTIEVETGGSRVR